jgi:hypothetical protein
MALIGWNDCDGDDTSNGAASSSNARCSLRCLTKILSPQWKGKKLRGCRMGLVGSRNKFEKNAKKRKNINL